MRALLRSTKEESSDEEGNSEERQTRRRRPEEQEEDDQRERGYAAADRQPKVPGRDSKYGTSGAGGTQRKLWPRLRKSVATPVAYWEPCNEKTKGRIKETFIKYTGKQNCMEQTSKYNTIHHTICH
ncbi:hypothetical protein NDU88_004531 [Pleurodeles waltl]|uniref:Uncharacterized protein n=1 Tax=Pleurodeles waltl TaxID=8319 RepID=A0AAV7V1H6_PLEWA|nr:hypothetical protein NDU88_004531 [Pleurodeles waltl]